MKHKVRVTVLKKNLYPELQQAHCADPHAGPCPCYHEGDVFEFYRDGSRDDFWHMGANTLVRTKGDPNTVAGGPQLPFCSEAGTPSPGTFTRACRAAPSCGGG